MSIVTRGGDQGETSLLYGGRVSKDDLRCEAYGMLDEAVSALGLARALAQEEWRSVIEELQRELFTVGAELATVPGQHDLLEKHFSPVTSDMVNRIDACVHELESRFPLPDAFIVPGKTPAGAALDVGRSALRTAERRAVALFRSGAIENAQLLAYLNRASDYIFMLARAVEGGDSTVK